MSVKPMTRRRWLAGLLFSLVALPALAEQTATMLLYQVKEPGLAPYSSRILVTPRYMRMDDGSAQGDYLLFNRDSRTIYSVTHSDGTVLEIHPRPVTIKSPLPLHMGEAEVPNGKGAPEIDGKMPHRYRLSVNGALCYQVVAAAGLLEDAVKALRAYRLVLAGENARVLPRIPADMNEPCDLALNTFAPDWQLKFGLPIQAWDPHGRGQHLVDFNAAYPVQRSLFVLPPNFRHYTPQAMP